MKRAFLCLLPILLLAGCAAGPQVTGQTPAPAPVETPAPIETPAPPPAVLCIADTLEEDEPAYFEAVRQQAERYGWEITSVEAPAGFENVVGRGGYDAILALRTQENTSIVPLQAAAKNGTPIALIDYYPAGATPESICYAAYREADMVTLVLETALDYPPHDTPVRMFGVFTGQNSEAALAYRAAIAEGRIFDRDSYYGTGGQSLEAFLGDALDQWVEGMVDCIYVENMALGLDILDLLREHGREDMEVFILPNLNVQEQMGRFHKYVYPVAFGPDVAAQVVLQSGELRGMLNGVAPEAWEFETRVFLQAG